MVYVPDIQPSIWTKKLLIMEVSLLIGEGSILKFNLFHNYYYSLLYLIA